MEEVIAYYFMDDLGDGSSCARFYKTKEAAQEAANAAFEEYGYGDTDVSSLRASDIQD